VVWNLRPGPAKTDPLEIERRSPIALRPPVRLFVPSNSIDAASLHAASGPTLICTSTAIAAIDLALNGSFRMICAGARPADVPCTPGP